MSNSSNLSTNKVHALCRVVQIFPLFILVVIATVTLKVPTLEGESNSIKHHAMTGCKLYVYRQDYACVFKFYIDLLVSEILTVNCFLDNSGMDKTELTLVMLAN